MATEEFLTEGRARVLRRLLYLTLAFAVITAVLGAIIGVIDFQRYVVTLLVIAVALAGAGGLTLRAVQGSQENARRLCIITGVLLLVLSLPLIGVFVGLLTAITGIGLLVVTVAPEREAQ